MFNKDRERPRRRRSMFGGMGPEMGVEMWRDWFGMGPVTSPNRGPAVRRGDVRDAILAVLAREPMHGYRIIGELSELSGGRWRPSAGSVYPTLQQLEDEGLVVAEQHEGRRVYSLTETGRVAAASASARGGPQWEAAPKTGGKPASQSGEEPAGAAIGASEVRPSDDLGEALRQLAAATAQAAQVGSPKTLTGVKTVLADARKSVYRLLAEDDEPGAE